MSLSKNREFATIVSCACTPVHEATHACTSKATAPYNGAFKKRFTAATQRKWRKVHTGCGRRQEARVASVVNGTSVFTRVRDTNDDPGSLNAMWPSGQLPDVWSFL